jgi:hypothetical protein
VDGVLGQCNNEIFFLNAQVKRKGRHWHRQKGRRRNVEKSENEKKRMNNNKEKQKNDFFSHLYSRTGSRSLPHGSAGSIALQSIITLIMPSSKF